MMMMMISYHDVDDDVDVDVDDDDDDVNDVVDSGQGSEECARYHQRQPRTTPILPQQRQRKS